MKFQRTGVSPEEFIIVWQQAGSVVEVCEKLNITRDQASSRAANYRALGIPLKKYRAGKLDVEALSRLAMDVQNEHG